MKAILIRESECENPEYDGAVAAACVEQQKPYNVPRTIKRPAGTMIDHPDSWQLCNFGMAIPADDECQARCGMTDDQLNVAIAAQERMQKGIGAYDVPELQKLKRKKNAT